MAKVSAPESEQIAVAQSLYRYQNFKSSKIPEKVKSNFYKGSSLMALHSIMRRYLATGHKDNVRASELFFDTLDKLRQTHGSILRPAASEEARPYSSHPGRYKKSKKINSTKDVTPSYKDSTKIQISAETMEKIKNKNTFIALRLEDSFMTFQNMDEMNGFLKACTQFGKSTEEFQKVKITVEKM